MDLLPIFRAAAGVSLELGGSWIMWYAWTPCRNTRDNGQPCFNERNGENWDECDLCGGRGYYYAKPKLFKGVYSDNSNRFIPDGSGGFMVGNKTLSIPPEIQVTILKKREGMSKDANTARRIGRDKFVILSPEMKPVETVYPKQDPTKPWVSGGVVYQIIEVESNF